MSTYVLIGNFSDKIRVVNISKNLESLTRTMKTLAVEYIHDAIGKKNYIDTLAAEYANVPVNKCPVGYVLKFSDTQNVSPKLTIFLNEKIAGYVYGATHKTTVVGYYIIVPADETDGEVVKAASCTNSAGDSRVDVNIRRAWGSLGTDLIHRIKSKHEEKVVEVAKVVADVAAEQTVVAEAQPATDLSSHIVDDHLKLTAGEVVTSAVDSVNVFKKELVEKALEIRAKIDAPAEVQQ